MKTKIKILHLKYLIAHLILGGSWLFFLQFSSDQTTALKFILSSLIIYLIAARHLDYTDAFVVFSLPWIMIIVFSLIPISTYAKHIHRETYLLIVLSLVTAMIAVGPSRYQAIKTLHWPKPRPSRLSVKYSLFSLDIIFILLTALNIAIAGYVPLLRGLATGYTGYTDFGVHGLYGFYLAFANALAIFNLVLYLRTNRKAFLGRYLFVIVIFVLFVTRQNLISTFMESVAVYSILRGRINWRWIAALVVFAAAGFSIIGLFRSGNIKEIASVRTKYLWLPEPVIWLYAYSYFNIANVDNMIHFSNAPYFDGSSFANLIPSFLRPSYQMGDYLQSASFNVSSYLYPVYQDIGTIGVIVLTFIAIRVTEVQYKKTFVEASLFRIGSYAVLYFCAAFSFFVNFWFYLPVIFQIVFFKLLSNLNERTARQLNETHTAS